MRDSAKMKWNSCGVHLLAYVYDNKSSSIFSLSLLTSASNSIYFFLFHHWIEFISSRNIFSAYFFNNQLSYKFSCNFLSFPLFSFFLIYFFYSKWKLNNFLEFVFILNELEHTQVKFCCWAHSHHLHSHSPPPTPNNSRCYPKNYIQPRFFFHSPKLSSYIFLPTHFVVFSHSLTCSLSLSIYLSFLLFLLCFTTYSIIRVSIFY